MSTWLIVLLIVIGLFAVSVVVGTRIGRMTVARDRQIPTDWRDTPPAP